jgi:hypothetical protein
VAEPRYGCRPLPASSPDDIAALWFWLATGRVPGGPDTDSRLRWQILLQLTVLGAGSRPRSSTTPAGTPPPPCGSLRRLLADQLEDLRRSLVVRSAA